MKGERLITDVLRRVREKKTSVAKAAAVLRGLPSSDMGFANIDNSRYSRCSLPEAVLCEGKTVPQIIKIARQMSSCRGFVLLTRLSQEAFGRLKKEFPKLKYNTLARIAYYRKGAKKADHGKTVLILAAGTSDIPVAEEAAATLEALGNRVETAYDVGVAGMHRLLNVMPKIRSARAIIVVAGMEGALASVVSGLASRPVIAVPTSCGYGASFRGIAPLLAMLNSCAAGVSVVNIDNGFGAACVASLIVNED